MDDTLEDIAHQLTRIADRLNNTGMQISEEQALKAWGLRVYEQDFLDALERLDIQIT